MRATKKETPLHKELEETLKHFTQISIKNPSATPLSGCCGPFVYQHLNVRKQSLPQNHLYSTDLPQQIILLYSPLKQKKTKAK